MTLLNIDANILSLLFAMKGTIYDKVWRTQEAVDAWETARKYALRPGNIATTHTTAFHALFLT